MFRGVRVGDAKHPGPPSARDPHSFLLKFGSVDLHGVRLFSFCVTGLLHFVFIFLCFFFFVFFYVCFFSVLFFSPPFLLLFLFCFCFFLFLSLFLLSNLSFCLTPISLRFLFKSFRSPCLFFFSSDSVFSSFPCFHEQFPLLFEACSM